MKLSLLFTFLLTVIINLFPDIFLQVYNQTEGFNDEAIPVIRMVTIGVLGMSVATVWLNAVTGSGNSKINLFIEIVAIVLYSTYLYLIFNVWNFSLVWIWSSELLYWGVLLVLSFIYMKSGKWKSKVI